MDQPDRREKLRTKLRKYFKRKSSQKIDRLYYEEPENFNILLSAIASQTFMKTLTAPLMRIKYIQQTAYESLKLKTRSFKFREAYTCILNRYYKAPRLFESA